ncbi:LytR/AlgR family response regulator transcription factor [Tenacibaculum jejuense]|uniref:HTH LytTR-type domain-containing protein n=1 Tax=Tenacibaculum jejuense TaxID=584609 RepID=A0A238U7T6_9FLAO|nr:LytTR family transcriptional regulator DNA-binding domain-containing protein [Tenacibaculum jejuense]SNR15253.1 Probable transmembrane protein of unknown function. Putative transcriptional regulator, LytTR family [Tenacibaculum jejuense]
MLYKKFPYSKSYRTHFFISIILSFFVLFILFFLEPFNSGNSKFLYKNLYLIGYGFITLFTYLICHRFSIGYYTKTEIWNFFEEVIFSFVFVCAAVVLAFFYTELGINKNPERVNLFHFLNWFKVIFLGFGSLLFVSTIFLRQKYLQDKPNNSNQENEPIKEIEKIQIKSKLKKESFYIEPKNILFIKSENNYIRIFFFNNEKVEEKLIRTTLTEVQSQFNSLLKTHRSYIVNPDYILSVKGNKQNAKINLKHIKYSIPVSKSLFDELINRI